MPRVLYRSSLSLLVDPKGAQRFLNQVLDAVDLESDDPVLGSVDVLDLLPGPRSDVHIVGPYYSRCSSETRLLMELASLAWLVHAINPRLIFEFGTFVGRTTRLLAMNGGPDAELYTLDLPQDQVTHEIGESFRESPEAHQIKQLYGDSREFDYSAWERRCDFVWVDACHDFNFVRNDSKQALALCRPGGWIAWHDYRISSRWSGVTRYLRELHRSYPGIRHLRGTTIAVLQKPGDE
jgi:predicted O-methyltransferase YrrM